MRKYLKRESFSGDVEYVDGLKIVKIKGMFTKETTPFICRGIEKNLKKTEIKGVLLDFSGVTEVDTTAFACMIDVIKNHVRDAGNIAVLNLKCKEKSLLKILKINKIINTFADEKKAISFLSGNV